MFTCISKAPGPLGPYPLGPDMVRRHNTRVMRVPKYPRTAGSFSQGAGTFEGDAVYLDKHSVISMG